MNRDTSGIDRRDSRGRDHCESLPGSCNDMFQERCLACSRLPGQENGYSRLLNVSLCQQEPAVFLYSPAHGFRVFSTIIAIVVTKYKFISYYFLYCKRRLSWHNY